jgi:hypothetical protein
MSFTGNYNMGLNDLKYNFNNGMGLSAEVYYYFNDSPFAISLSISSNVFNASDEYKEAYIDAQNNILENFSYEIKQYAIPILISGNYRFFRTKKFQPVIGISAGLYSLVHKLKQTSEYFSDTRMNTQNEFGIYPHISLMYEITNGIGILLKGGYNQTLGTQSISYADIHLGLIYKI